MKTLLFMFALVTPLAAQYHTNRGRPLNGLAYDDPPKPAPARVEIHLSEIPADSPRYQTILAAVRREYPGITDEEISRRARSGPELVIRSPKWDSGHRQHYVIRWQNPATK